MEQGGNDGDKSIGEDTGWYVVAPGRTSVLLQIFRCRSKATFFSPVAGTETRNSWERLNHTLCIDHRLLALSYIQTPSYYQRLLVILSNLNLQHSIARNISSQARWYSLIELISQYVFTKSDGC